MSEEQRDLFQENGPEPELTQPLPEREKDSRGQAGQGVWSRPMHRIALGFILTELTLEFLGLSVIMPAVGMLLLYLGCRQLRQENRWFRRAWMVGLVRLVLAFVNVILLLTPIPTDVETEASGLAVAVSILLVLIGLCLKLLLLWNLHQAVAEVYDRVNQIPPRAPYRNAMIAVLVLSGCAFVLPILFFNGILMIGLLVWWIWILYGMYRLGTEMDALSFGFTPAGAG